MKKYLKNYLYTLPFVIVCMIVAFLIILLSFPIHELGHATFATVSAMALHYNSTTLNFTYIPLFVYFKVPQQTIATLPTSPIFTIPYGLAGVFFTTIFYCFLFLLTMYSKIVRESKQVQTFLSCAMFTLIIDSVLENLVCGTDGIKLTCHPLVLSGIFLLSLFLFAIFLGLAMIIYVKIRRERK